VVLFDLDTTLRHGQIRIYPGYDLEAAGLPPDVAQAIFEQDIAPLAAAGDLDGALLGGLVAIDSTLREAAGLTGGTSSGTGGGPAVAWTPGPDEPVVVDEPGIPTFGGPLPDPGGGPGAFLPLFILVGIAGVAFSLITGAGRRGGGGDPDVAHRAWWSRNDDDGPRMGGGSWGGSDGGGGSGGFGGGGDSGGSGGGGGAF
jgi:hypothetical protein